jgi:hypothetical protein
VERFWQNESGEVDAMDWKKEEWLIKSALVPIEELGSIIETNLSPHDLSFRIGWNTQNEFDFGSSIQHGEFHLYPLIRFSKHPISQRHDIGLTNNFLNYHALQKRNQTDYIHPIDDILVAEVCLDNHEIYEDSGRVSIYIDYLRDFLAATRKGVIISIIADRFSTAETEEKLGISHLEEFQLDDYTWIRTDIHSPQITHSEFYRGRSTLRRNIAIEPYERPKYERNPWPYYGEDLFAEEEDYPQFIINSQGEKRTLPRNVLLTEYIQQDIGEFGYLWFHPEVLQRYLTTGYSIYFHMRTWGIASSPGNQGTIDVGINSVGKVNAFAPDIADLAPSEQAYWASYSSLPSGEVCEEMFQTRMQSVPPDSPGVIDVIRESRSYLGEKIQEVFNVELFRDWEPSQRELDRLSVGPITINQYDEVLELGKTLYGWVIETMQITPLRSVLDSLGGSINDKWRQIRLIEEILVNSGLARKNARDITASLVGLNELRVGSAHIGEPDLDKIFQLFGSQALPQTSREGWNICIDALENCLITIVDNI